jgi:N-acetylglutamate synthase-like GNAT family acetyltransferase
MLFYKYMKWNIQIDKNIYPQELIDLWVSVDWGKDDDYKKDDVDSALKNTSAVIKASDENNKLIGLARILSDNQYHTVLAEIVIHPSYQRQGVGKEIIKKLISEYGHTAIYLDTLPDNEQFFASQGFIKREKMSVYSRAPKK